MKQFILFSALSLCTCNLSLLASAPAKQNAVENIKGVLEMYQEKSRCPSPSVNQSSSSCPPAAVAAEPEKLVMPAELRKILRAENKNEDYELLQLITNKLIQLSRAQELPYKQAIRDFKTLLPFHTVYDSKSYRFVVQDNKGNPASSVGLNPTLHSAILLRAAGLTYTHRFHKDYSADFIRQDVQKLLTSLQ